MDPKLLVQLATIVASGSVTRAAERLHLTQPTLSRSIKLIEARVGGPVLRRNRYGVEPTAIGLQLAEQGEAIRRRSENARRAITAWQAGLGGTLAVGVGPMLAAACIGEFLADSLSEQGHPALNVTVSPARRLIAALHEGDLDLALIPSQLNLHTDTLSQQTLFEDRLAVFTSRDNPLAARAEVEPEALAGGLWIASGASSGLLSQPADVFALLGIDAAPVIEISGEVSCVGHLLAGTGGYCLLPLRLGRLFARHVPIAPLPLSVELPERDISAWTRRGDAERPEVAAFVARVRRFLVERLK